MSLFHLHWTVHLIFLTDLIIRLGLCVRVIMRRLPVGVALAWLTIVLVFPFVGAVFYLLVGEYRLGRVRGRRSVLYEERRKLQPKPGPGAAAVDIASLGRGAAALARLARTHFGAEPLAGHRLELLRDANAAFPSLVADIDRARVSCCLEFYIWSAGGCADDVSAALIRAALRGVECRVLLDALGSSAFVKSSAFTELRQKGVRVELALRAGLHTVLSVRPDLRMHRKIVVIDGEIGYTGSLNLADPKLFKQDAGVGQWVDAVVRVHGPAVAALMATFAEDWFVETDEWLDVARLHGDRPDEIESGSAAVQVLPSGPGPRVDAIEQVVLMALYAAEREVVLTTPYFVPTEALLTALLSTASRGVMVTLIVPAKIDSKFVHFGSRAFQIDLLTAGVRVALFRNGLLHTKSITVDGTFSLFGSVNLDPRSFRLDLEITLAVYDAEFTAALGGLQQHYLDQSDMLDLAICRARSAIERFAEDTARLAGPVL